MDGRHLNRSQHGFDACANLKITVNHRPSLRRSTTLKAGNSSTLQRRAAGRAGVGDRSRDLGGHRYWEESESSHVDALGHIAKPAAWHAGILSVHVLTEEVEGSRAYLVVVDRESGAYRGQSRVGED
jgi:hypothetical protein